METSFIWPMSGSGDFLSGKIIYNESPLLSTKNDKNHGVKWVKEALNAMICPRFRISILNFDETVKYIIPNSDIQLGGGYSEEYQSIGQRKSLSFTLINTDGKYTPSVFNLHAGTKVLFESGAYLQNDDVTILFKKGIFVINSVKPSESPSQSPTIQVECGDKYCNLENGLGILSEGIEIKIGSDIRDVIEDTLLTQTGNGDPIDPIPIIYHSSFIGKKTEQTISLSPGSTYGNLLESIAEMISAEIFYNANGNLTVIPIVEIIHDGDKPLIKTFKDYKGEILSNSFSLDYSKIVNYVRVTGGTVNGHTCYGIAKNDDPSSPINCNRIGYRFCSPISDDAISSDIIAQERAEYELRLKTIFSTSFSISVPYDPTVSVNNIIGFTDGLLRMYEERFLIQGISYDIGYEGTMSITISNINNLPFLTRRACK